MKDTQPLLVLDGRDTSVSCDGDMGIQNSYYGSSSNPGLLLTVDEAMDRLEYGRFHKAVFIATGLVMMADSLQVLLLTFLTPVLQTTSWQLNNMQASMLSASVFAGAIVGALILGSLADRLGRKVVFVWTTGCLSFAGLLSSIAPTFIMLLACRFAVGFFSVGGLAVPFVTLSEWLPSSHRGNNLLLIEFFWTGGSVMVVVLAYFTLGQGHDGAQIQKWISTTHDDFVWEDGYESATTTITTFSSNADNVSFFAWEPWRYFVMFASLPAAVATLWAIYFVPESPRWLLNQKDPLQAMHVLRQAAKFNGMASEVLFPPHTQLQPELNTDSNGGANDDAGFWDLLKPKWRRLTLVLWGTWFGFSFLYYGSVIAATMVFASDKSGSNDDDSDEGSYHFDYAALIVSSSAEILGNLVMVATVDSWGRIPTQVVAYGTGGVALFILCWLAAAVDESGTSINSYRQSMVVLAFCTRMLMMISSCTTWVSTTEVLPTPIRATGQSAANAMARLGGFVCPFLVSQSFSLRTVGTILFVVAIATAGFARNLPETKGRAMGLGLEESDGDDASNSAKEEHQPS